VRRVAFASCLCIAAALGASQSLAQTAPPFDFDDDEPPPVSDEATPEDIDQAGEENTTTVRDTQRSSAGRIASFISTRINRSLVQRFGTGLAGFDSEPDEAKHRPRHRGYQLASRSRNSWTSPQIAQDSAPATPATPWSAWGNLSATMLENTNDSTGFDGTLINPLAGADYAFAGGWIGGVTLGYERIDLDTDFGGRDGDLEGDGLSIVPYAGTRVADGLLLDGGAGYTYFDYRREDTLGAADGSFDGHRFLGFTNLTALAPTAWAGQAVSLSAKAGLLYAHEFQTSFAQVESQTIQLGQINLGGEAAYRFALDETSAPSRIFANATFNFDLIQEDTDAFGNAQAASDDRSEVVLGAGADIGVTPRLSLNAGYNVTLGREDIDSQTVTVGFRLTF
jgi:outer membrane autotransporter protein